MESTLTTLIPDTKIIFLWDFLHGEMPRGGEIKTEDFKFFFLSVGRRKYVYLAFNKGGFFPEFLIWGSWGS